ncbi:T9SS type A sorting domain-containing protein [Bizionia sp. KMM 8389]
MNLQTKLLLLFTLGIGYGAHSQIVNKGQLKIASDTDVYFENEYTNSSSGTHVSNGDLHLNDNFINDGDTDAESGTTYFKSATNTILNLSGNQNQANFYNLEIDITGTGAKGLTVSSGFLLAVENSVNFQNGDLRLNGSAELVQTHVGVSANTQVSGGLLIDQYGASSPYHYDYWSSPVSNYGAFNLEGGKFDGSDSYLAPFDPKQILFNTGSPYNGLPSEVDEFGEVTTALTVNRRWLYKYSRGSGGYSNWMQISPTSDIFPGEGYTMKGPNSDSFVQNYVFHGTPNDGTYQFPISNGESVLLGNPYPSTLDAVKFLTDNIAITDAIYYWVDGGSSSHMLSDYLGGYAIRNITGGAPPSIPLELISGVGAAGSVESPSRYVPIAKGFFVDATSDGLIVFNNSQRVTELIADRSEGEALDTYIRIGYEDPEGFHRQLLLGFMPNSMADENYNPGYDALQLATRDDDMFFVIEDAVNKHYAIQGVGSFSQFSEFPIGLKLSEMGSHKIMIDAVENYDGPIYIKDNVLNETYEITASDFNINLPLGNYTDRYSIVFQPSETLSVEATELQSLTTFYNGKEQLVITNPNHLNINQISIHNVIGQHILTVSENLPNQDKIVIPFNQNDGVYIVTVTTESAQKSTKILKY